MTTLALRFSSPATGDYFVVDLEAAYLSMIQHASPVTGARGKKQNTELSYRKNLEA